MNINCHLYESSEAFGIRLVVQNASLITYAGPGLSPGSGSKLDVSGEHRIQDQPQCPRSADPLNASAFTVYNLQILDHENSELSKQLGEILEAVNSGFIEENMRLREKIDRLEAENDGLIETLEVNQRICSKFSTERIATLRHKDFEIEKLTAERATARHKAIEDRQLAQDLRIANHDAFRVVEAKDREIRNLKTENVKLNFEIDRLQVRLIFLGEKLNRITEEAGYKDLTTKAKYGINKIENEVVQNEDKNMRREDEDVQGKENRLER
ncbi:hypothetical protein FKW77_007296 [Venturia effusa]|uniref:Uncharacterized protein n=1 Tax=Venturia effusa TaxID=50376 RepID=A0A517KWS5_9PEZI|nr:hypothetical protein FKW77_007296 [Venturia effusa]